MMPVKRVLYLDGIPSGEKLVNVVIVQDKEGIDSLYSGYFCLLEPPHLTLDCRQLHEHSFNTLLKFFEEYKGSLVLIARDPVPVPVLSRFTVVKKIFKPKEGILMEIRLRNLPHSIRAKVYGLFGIVQDENEAESVTS